MQHLASAMAMLLLASLAVCGKSQSPPGRNAILLSNVQTLTLRANRMTTSRRVSPIPQLSCTGPSKKICDLYQIETMRCTNEGYDYDEEDVQWTCTAPLPSEFKLGSTDVVCEGYRHSEDKWVLKGSCGVEYRMLLTEQGERRFGQGHDGNDWSSWMGSWNKPVERKAQKGASMLGDLIFFGFIIAVAAIIFVPLLRDCFGTRRNRPGRAPRRGGGGFWGGGGGDYGHYPGPPPPYSSYSDGSASFGSKSRTSGQSWTPGFWTGALGGAAAGYQMGRRAGNGGSSSQRGSSSRIDSYDAGEGSSRTRSPQFSTTTTSTGFGSTKRR
ncbi:uncharacterized protein N7459_009681 [Penicillium hispanicum]|uniref:uncharacterized protein n=1 Tax=Penicillium hispanicum TaxID=1080232 RepID=UPI0025420CB3|nr:uncharacterized protein N7459_009681 [Penicillium hispanicum]KAJ5570251.1 hypothetical protein N7459_009681 [Penicillium hispanicum]